MLTMSTLAKLANWQNWQISEEITWKLRHLGFSVQIFLDIRDLFEVQNCQSVNTWILQRLNLAHLLNTIFGIFYWLPWDVQELHVQGGDWMGTASLPCPHTFFLKMSTYIFLDAIASPIPLSVSQSVIDSFRLDIVIASPSFASLIFNCPQTAQ